MKKILGIASFFLFISQIAFAQFDEIKTLLTLNQYAKAKESLDLLANKPKVVAKPEYYITKATILSYLLKNKNLEIGLKDSEVRIRLGEPLKINITNGTFGVHEQWIYKDDLFCYIENGLLTAWQGDIPGISDYKKYLSMDPNKALILDPVYSAAPINFYVSYFGQSVDFFNKKNWARAAPSLKTTLEWSDFIINNKIANMTFDTTANLLAGVSYQNDNKEEEAAYYYKRMADLKIGGADNDIIYRFLMNYYFIKDSIAGFNKMRKDGLELYPDVKYFTYNDLDFILEMEDEGKKFKRIEDKISREPNNIEVVQTYAFLLFNRLNADSAAFKISTYDAEEAKMIDFLTKVGEAKPDDGTALFYAGSHYWNRALRVKDEIGLINDTIRIFNSTAKADKAGKLPPPPKALTDRRDNLRKLQDVNLDKALPYLLKAVPAIEKSSTKGKTEFQTYKRVIDQLIEIYSTKRQYAKLPADKAKFEVEEKKWDALYTKITEK